MAFRIEICDLSILIGFVTVTADLKTARASRKRVTKSG